ncbi:MAG: hypothetical protein ACR2JZ_01935 [Candidatus Limnocylindrales bacterium]
MMDRIGASSRAISSGRLRECRVALALLLDLLLEPSRRSDQPAQVPLESEMPLGIEARWAVAMRTGREVSRR